MLSSDMDASRVIIPYTLMNRMVIIYRHSGHKFAQTDLIQLTISSLHKVAFWNSS